MRRNAEPEAKPVDMTSTFAQLDSMLDTNAMVANNLSRHLERRGAPAHVEPLPLIPIV